MTEKRYTYSELYNCQYSVDYTTFKEIYGEENVFHSRICEVNNKKQAQKVVDLLNEQDNRIKELEKENMEYYKLINCRKCKYHNYDSYANGDDFEICEKGNNERLIYYYFCNEFEK